MKTLLIIFLMAAKLSQAQEFRPDSWEKGLHLLAGGGVNATYVEGNDFIHGLGYGLNFKTDLGYYFTRNLAVEWSSNVKFNQADGFLIWDTLITGGFRYRVSEYFLRAFYGKAPTVVFFKDGEPVSYKRTKSSRIQYDGPVAGIGFGKMFQTKNNYTWFIELSGTFQKLKEAEFIRMSSEVPEVLYRDGAIDSEIYTIYAMAGIVVF